MAFIILSVDDEMDMQELLRQKFRRQIRKEELQFLHATNGKEGLKVLQEHPEINMVLADINMPIMDGLTFLAEVSKLNRTLLKVVILSAYGDMRNIRLAMNSGAFDFINKPIDFSDLERTIAKTKDRIKYLKNQQKRIERLTFVENEVKAAAQIQSSLLPKINGVFREFNQVQISTFLKPARYVGGDFYDVLQIDDKHLGFFIADVSGKGIAASAFMLMSHTAVKVYAQQALKPNEVLRLANNYLSEENDEAMFTTIFYGILNVETGEFEYSNGGHNPPFLFSQDKLTELERTKNTALGVIGDMPYGLKKIELKPGDEIIMFTDGVSEAQNVDNEEFGEDRICDVIRDSKGLNPTILSENLFKSLEQFRGKAKQFDDITIFNFQWR